MTPTEAHSTWTDHLLDNGPFGGNLYQLTTWQHPNSTADGRGHLVFERNERFWGKKPLLRRIEYTLYRAVDLRAQWQDFTHGDGDSAHPYISVSDSDTSAIAQARTLPGVVLQQVPDLSLQYLAINWKYAPFDDMRVRQAFSLALDRQAIEHEISLDTSQPTIHLAPEGMPGYNPDLTDAAGRKGKDALTPDLDIARGLVSAYAAEKCGGSFPDVHRSFFLYPMVVRDFSSLERCCSNNGNKPSLGGASPSKPLDGDAI